MWQVSYPTSPSYGKYLSTEQIGDMVAPPSERLERLFSWLRESGVSPDQCELSLHRDFLTVSLSVSSAESLLKTEFFDFVHSSGKLLSRASVYHVPLSLGSDLDFIGGVGRFPSAKPHGIQSMLQKSIGMNFEPSELPTGNSPILGYLSVGDAEFTLNFIPRCEKGQVLTYGHLGCGNHSVYAAVVSWQSTSGPHTFTALLDVATSVPPGQGICKPSSDWDGVVQTAQLEVLKKYNLGPNTIFCSVRVHQGEATANFRTISVKLNIEYTMRRVTSQDLTLPAITPAPWVTPRRLMDYYRMPTGLQNYQAKNAQSVTEFLGQYYSPDDLRQFMRSMGLLDYNVTKLIGPNDIRNPGLEASLDIQYMLGISHNVDTWFWSLGQLHEGQEPFLQWLIDLSNTPTVPYVHSTSYADEEQSLSLEYMTRINTELVKAGVRGLTLLFSSGDDGVGGYSLRTDPDLCTKRGYAPEFPSSSPYVTAVGGTQFSDQYLPICTSSGKNEFQGELTYTCEGVGEIVSSSSTGSRITSGGGFSINFAQPAYQKDAVEAFLKYSDNNGLTPNQKNFNRQGRALPDISGMAHNYITVIAGDIVPVDGTSASTPVTAAFLTLINDRLLSINRPVIGFFNPLLYQLGASNLEVFKDVVVGDNACSAMRDICCTQGFYATPGWDATTGFGSPVFDALYSAIGGANPWA